MGNRHQMHAVATATYKRRVVDANDPQPELVGSGLASMRVVDDPPLASFTGSWDLNAYQGNEGKMLFESLAPGATDIPLPRSSEEDL